MADARRLCDAAQAAQVISGWGFTVTPDMISQIAQDVGEKTLLSRTGGAPTLAVGMAHILSGMFGGRVWMGLWYHFAIMFEALFILTTIDTGTRIGRFFPNNETVIGALPLAQYHGYEHLAGT